jgi:hypothetical protein
MGLKFEYRNPKFETISNDQNLNDQNILITPMALKNFFACFELLDIRISDLFRISCFGFRIYSLFFNCLIGGAY